MACRAESESEADNTREAAELKNVVIRAVHSRYPALAERTEEREKG
jgi:Mg2+/Co2+ transporter CorC